MSNFCFSSAESPDKSSAPHARIAAYSDPPSTCCAARPNRGSRLKFSARNSCIGFQTSGGQLRSPFNVRQRHQSSRGDSLWISQSFRIHVKTGKDIRPSDERSASSGVVKSRLMMDARSIARSFFSGKLIIPVPRIRLWNDSPYVRKPGNFRRRANSAPGLLSTATTRCWSSVAIPPTSVRRINPASTKRWISRPSAPDKVKYSGTCARAPPWWSAK